MDDRRVADYFVVAGLPDNPIPLEEFSNEAAIKPTYKQDPITDITVINKSISEKVPRGYVCLERTPTDYQADLNHGTFRCPEMYICFRRSRDKPPLTDVGVLYEGKERLMGGCEVVHTTYFGSPANINNGSSGRIYITYRRAPENAPSDMLAVVDLCVILENKGETPPHSYNEIHKNLNKGLVGSDVFLCYKKAMTKTDILAYKPAILDRYPKEDYEDFPLPEQVAMFCLPMGATVECWSAKAQHPFPVFSTFILTGIGWQKVYGAAITFYEEFPEEKLTDLQMRHLGLKNKHIREQYRIMKTVHYNKSICLLSHWPFFDAFRKLLTYMYRISITGPHIVPIERHISHFMYDVPYPSPQRPRILVQLSHDSLSLSMPEDSPLPQSGASHITMLKNLGPENCMTILLYVLHEYKVVIHSLRPAVLTSVAEAVSTLIFPLQWQCPYIPLCPLGLSDYLNAPTPYIIGLDSRYFDLFDPPPEVICIDLDTIRIWPSEDKKNVSYKMLPKKAQKILQETLHKLYDKLSVELPRHTQDEVTLDMAPIDIDFKKKHKEMLLELQIQEAFLRFMACIMKGYKNFLKPIENVPNLDTTKASVLFDMQGFLKSRDKTNHKFFQALMSTQLFNRFIEERSFVSDKDASLAFFDECIEKVDENRDEPKLIELDDNSKSERTMFILPPEPVGLPEGKKYSYNGFPNLTPELFSERKTAVVPSQTKKSQTGQNSPVARRTKQEVKTAQKLAKQFLGQPLPWAKCLLSHCYSLWFMMLPAYIKHSKSVNKALKVAYDVLKDMQKQKLKPPDELCYRVMLQLCGSYNQPVLAVKVYSEMKHAGVQPNAITYGYYNKAVLEGMWPSSISRGRKLWRKIRNVIIGVAKFRKAIRRRSLSVYSNSGSEFDQISRTSIDSFLEDTAIEGKNEPIMKGEASAEVGITGAKHGKIPEELERATSDRGYNSMTQEDAKTFSELISAENKNTESKLKKDMKNVLRFSFRKKHKKKESEIQEESASDEESEEEADDDSAFRGTDNTTADQFRSRVGSIVRKCSVSNNTSHEPKKDILFGSKAGLLMVSKCLEPGSLSHSMGHPVGHTKSDSQRKRHKSAGDHTTKTRSNSLFANWKIKHINDKDSIDLKLNVLIAKDDSEVHVLENGVGGSGPGIIGDMQDIVEEIKDSGVALDENECLCDDVSDVTSVSGKVEDESGETEAQSNIIVTEETLNEHENASNSEAADNIDVNSIIVRSRSGSLKSNTSSPLHSVPTPVTENDPLGLFVEPRPTSLKSLSPNTSPQKSREKFVTTKPFQGELKIASESQTSGECNITNNAAAEEQNRVDNSYQSAMGRVMSPVVEKVQSTLFKMERTSSFPENLGSNLKGEIKTPGKQRTEKQTVDPRETVSLGRSSSSLNEGSLAGTPRGGLFRTGSFRRHKENFSGMLKFATGAVANKLTEIKMSMTPTKLGSNTSIGHADDMDTDDEDSLQESRRKASNAYYSSYDKLDSSSINGTGTAPIPESAPSHPSFMDQFDQMFESDTSSFHVQFADTITKDIAIEAEICSCSRCPRCRCLLYDEEIMAGWSADDSNLNTSCPFCNTKLVPHLLIYLKDNRGRKKNLVDLNDSTCSENGENFNDGEGMMSPTSYGKDSTICSGDSQLLFGEDFEDDTSVKSLETSQDPWMRQSAHEASQPQEIPAAPKPEGESMAQMALAGRHRRTGSECLTSATENMCAYGSSLESVESFTFQNMRSPLSMSVEAELLSPLPSLNPETKRSPFEIGTSPLDPVSVPYLSPLVLRKNLETIIESEGNSALARDTFVDEHPIIFWNLVWYLQRINTPSHLPAFLLTSPSYNKDPEANLASSYSSENVLIRPMWDNIRIHEEVGLPMHMAWNKGVSSTTVDALITEAQPFNRAVMNEIITSIQCNHVLGPMKIVMNCRRRFRPRRKRFRSMYREILYLSFMACGRENIDPDAFDREYRQAFTKLSGGEIKRLQRDDKPRSQLVQFCRKAFSALEI